MNLDQCPIILHRSRTKPIGKEKIIINWGHDRSVTGWYFTRINLTFGEFEKLVESQWDRNFFLKKSISRKIFFDQIPLFHFLKFQKWSKINFWNGKKFKTARNAISRKKKRFIWFHEFFFAWTFFNFLAHCGILEFVSN